MKPFFRKSCIFAFAVSMFFHLALVQIAQAQIKTTHVAGAVHMLTGRGGNIGVSAGEDGILMVDDKFAPLAPKIKAALGASAQKNLSPSWSIRIGTAIIPGRTRYSAKMRILFRTPTSENASP